jgi:hypothetical protein
VIAAVRTTSPLGPILDTLDGMHRRRPGGRAHGVAPGLVVTDPAGWLPAEQFADGTALPDLIHAAEVRWGVRPAGPGQSPGAAPTGAPPVHRHAATVTVHRHAAAAVAWKAYTYWLALPAVLGYAAAQRVPDMSAGNTLVRVHPAGPFLEFGLRRPLVAVPEGDPLAGQPGVREVPDLAGFLREGLLDGHLTPVLDGLHELVRIGRRTLLGSLASGVGHGLVRARDHLPGPVGPTADALLAALGVADLVEITAEPAVRRRTCCLAFTLPEPRVCQGCCISPAG